MTDGIYLTKNGIRRWYPLAEIDLSQLIADGKTSTFSLPGYGDDAAEPIQYGYRIDRNDGGAAYLSGTISDPRSADQFVYFSGDTIAACYEQVTLSDEPDDYFATNGHDNPPTPHHYNTMYYTGTSYGGNVRLTYALSQNAFSPGTYYKNESMQGVYFTDKGYSVGACFNNTFSPGIGVNVWEGFTHLSWYCHNSGLNLDWFYQPQYGNQNPRVCGSNVTYISWSDSAPSGDDPATPTDWISQFVYGEYNGDQYIGFIIFRTDADGNPSTSGKFAGYMMPLWWWGELAPPPEPPGPVVPDPGDFGPDSTPDAGGDGTYTDTNDAPGLPDTTPLVGSTWSHGMHVYRVGDTEYNNLLAALWGLGDGGIGDTLWQRYQNYRCSPLSGILSSHYIPYYLGAVPPILPTTQAIRCAGTTIPDTTSWVVNDCYISTYTVGTLSVPEYFGSALDYSPYTVMRLFLPFCGWIDIDPDRVVGGGITVRYVTDNITGDCTAFVQCTDRTGSVTSMYTASGNCAVQLPVTGNDQGFGTMLNAASSAIMSAASGNVLGVASSAASLLSARKQMSQAGSYSGTTALTGDHQCRLQIIRPVQSTPAYGQQLRGRPSDIGCIIGDLVGTGWTSFDAVHADIEGATVEECAEIERLLQQGVIL